MPFRLRKVSWFSNQQVITFVWTRWKISWYLLSLRVRAWPRGSGFVLGRKWCLGGSKLRPWSSLRKWCCGAAGHKWPRSLLMALWWVWAPTNWDNKPERWVRLWEAPTGPGDLPKESWGGPSESGKFKPGWHSETLKEGQVPSDLFLAYVFRWVNKNSFPLICICWTLSVCLCGRNDAFGHVLAMLAELKASSVHELEESISLNTL